MMYVDGNDGSIMYNQNLPSYLQRQEEAFIEPVDLEDVRKIQASMPAANPEAPVGSNKNPIRIIQQGSQYITTQDVSNDHLQQIIQVLTTKALVSTDGDEEDGQGGNNNKICAIYNRFTNKRIIFRVTKAKRRRKHQDEEEDVDRDDRVEGDGGMQQKFNEVRSRHSFVSGCGEVREIETSPQQPKKRGRKKGKRVRIEEEEDPDFEPDMPEEEILPFPIVRRKTNHGRISKPPKHLIKDYKHLRLEELTSLEEEEDVAVGYKNSSTEMTEKAAVDSDGGYSDYINEGFSDDDSMEIIKSRAHECVICEKSFHNKAGLARHKSIVHNPNGRLHVGPWSNPHLAAIRRRTKLKEALQNATPEDLIEFAAPRLASVMPVWEYLLVRSEAGDPPLPQMTKLVLEYLGMVETFRNFIAQHLEPSATVDRAPALHMDRPAPASVKRRRQLEAAVAMRTASEGYFDAQEMIPEDEALRPSPSDTDDSIIDVRTSEEAQILALPVGQYRTKKPLSESCLPERYRLLANAASAVVTTAIINPKKSAKSKPPKCASVVVSTGEISSGFQGEDQEQMPLPSDQVQQSVEPEEQALSTFIWGGTLFCLHNEGLGYAVPDEWITTGAFLPVLADTGESSDLAMEGVSGRLFYRPTGQLVTMVTDPPVMAPQLQAVEPDEENEADLPSEPSGAIDLNSLLPGVEISEISPGICMVTKADGMRFQVEHGGEGITLETLQVILQMDVIE